MNSRPDFSKDLILADQQAGVLDQATEDVKAFRPQIKVAVAGPQAPTRGIEGKTVERINPRSGLFRKRLHANNPRGLQVFSSNFNSTVRRFRLTLTARRT